MSRKKGPRSGGPRARRSFTPGQKLDLLGRFASLAQARAFMTDFVTWYNHCHRHSGIGLHTPADVHHGRHHTVRAAREDTLTAARAAHPERFGASRPLPKILDLPDKVWINRPDQETKTMPQAA